MPEEVPFQLGRGDTGPVQQSSLTCGSACLTVARMLVSPELAGWIVNGVSPQGGAPDPRSEPERFAEHEREVMSRTNGLHGAGGRLNLPWPQSLGTPPWGAEKELEHGAARPGAAYAMQLVRSDSTKARRDVYGDLLGRVAAGLPALLYIGNAWSPRHVTLVLPGRDPDAPGSLDESDGDGQLNVYDPATGSVGNLDPDRFATGRLAIAGWDVPWITVHPRKR